MNKVIISMPSALPQVGTDKLLQAFSSRLDTLLVGSTPMYTERKSIRTYSGVTDLDLIAVVQDMSAALVRLGVLAVVSDSTGTSDLDALMPGARCMGTQSQFALSRIDVPGHDKFVLGIQLFRFGKSKTYGYVVSVSL